MVRNKNTFTVLMNNYKRIEELSKNAQDSAGFSDTVQEKWEKSLQARINEFKTSGQQLWQNILGGNEAANTISVLTNLLDILNNISKVIGGMPTMIGVFGGVLSMMGGGWSIMLLL